MYDICIGAVGTFKKEVVSCWTNMGTPEILLVID